MRGPPKGERENKIWVCGVLLGLSIMGVTVGHGVVQGLSWLGLVGFLGWRWWRWQTAP